MCLGVPGRVVRVDGLLATVDFFGVRKQAHYQADFTQLKVWQVITAGIVSIAVFVLAIYGLVQLVTR